MYNFDVKKVTEDCIKYIQDWFAENGKGCNAVVGISGGIDSSVVAALCTKALGKNRVIGVMMPNGRQNDIEYSHTLIHFLDIQPVLVPIGSIVNALQYEIKTSMDSELSEQTLINIPPRIRMTTLYAVSQSLNGRVINTSNLSESWCGYDTIYGDSAGDMSPLANLTKTEVIAIGRYLGLPEKLLSKAPSDGLTGKTDEEVFGFTYYVLDRYLRTGEIDDLNVKRMINERHERNLFKMKRMAAFDPYFGVMCA